MRNNFYWIIICIIALLFFSGCSTNTTNTSKDNYNTNKDNSDLDLSCPDCNVLFLDIELLRADYVGLINPESNATPNIDKFFKDAIIFEDVSSASGVTRISNYATLTSQDGTIIKLLYTGQLETMSKLPTIAEALKSSGYKTINVNEDNYGQSGRSQLLDRGFDVYISNEELREKYNYPGRAMLMTNEVLMEQEKELNKSKFFLQVRADTLHAEYEYPIDRPRINYSEIRYENVSGAPFYKTKRNLLGVPSPLILVAKNEDTKINNTALEVISNQEVTHALYQQQVVYVDEELGKIFSYLENSSLLNNTIVVVYSNHGEGLFDNSILTHGVAYQSCVHVPLLIRHPKIHEQIRITEPVSLIDLTPTVYDMTNSSAPKEIEGISLIPVILTGKYSRKYIYGLDDSTKYIRLGNMKLMVWISGKKELYNISIDPHEENNVVDQYPEITSNMYTTLIAHQINETKRATTIFPEIARIFPNIQKE